MLTEPLLADLLTEMFGETGGVTGVIFVLQLSSLVRLVDRRGPGRRRPRCRACRRPG